MQATSARKNRVDIQTMAIWALFCALAYVSVVLIRIPVAGFLDLEPKDVILTIAAFLYGPVAGLVMATVVSLVEMVTISATGFIGFIMNVLSSASFVCVAALIYRRKRTFKSAIAGLAAATLCLTVVMVLWNILITPLYMGVPREQVIGMLATVFLPFNLAKGAILSVLTVLLYRPALAALSKARLLPVMHEREMERKSRHLTGIILVSLAVLATGVVTILAINGIL